MPIRRRQRRTDTTSPEMKVPFVVPDWPAMKPINRRLSDIKPYEHNPRTHPPEQINLLARLMREHGVDQPIVVDEDGVILKGHGRLMAAAKAGFEEFPVVTHLGLSEQEKKALRIADNQVALLGGWDKKLMLLEAGELQSLGYNLELLGFEDYQLRSFGIDTSSSGAIDPDADVATPDGTPVSSAGDIWILGDHRLACGDSSDADVVAKVLAGVVPHLMVTDPPYGVDYDPTLRGRGLAAWKAPRAVGPVKNDDTVDWTSVWNLFPGDVIYCWSPPGRNSLDFLQSLKSCSFDVRAQIIWAKPHPVIGRGNYHQQHEPCLYAVRKGKTAHWCGDRTQGTVWSIKNRSSFGGTKDDSSTNHSTQKPIECMRRPIENNSNPGESVYDPFVGSGTTIIAAEMTGRRCFAIDIEPTYVDVSVIRWQQFSNKEAILESSGETFETVRLRRIEERRD